MLLVLCVLHLLHMRIADDAVELVMIGPKWHSSLHFMVIIAKLKGQTWWMLSAARGGAQAVKAVEEKDSEEEEVDEEEAKWTPERREAER